MSPARIYILFLISIGMLGLGQAQPVDLVPHLQYPSSQLFFESNAGQFEDAIRYQCASGQTQVRFLTDGLSVAQVREKATGGHIDSDTHEEWENYRWYGEIEPHYEALVWNLSFLGATPTWTWEPYRSVPGRFSYLKGKGNARSVERVAEVWAEDLYPDIDLRYYGASSHQLKYDFVVRPGGDVGDIKVQATGISGMQIEADGSMTIATQWGDLTEAKPYAYQVIRGQKWEVTSQYVLLDDSTFGFRVGGLYDASLPLVIDPVTLSWSTFFHTSLSDDYVISTYRDSAGYVYMTGYSKAVNFPITPGVYQDSIGGDIDVFVTKFYPGGSSLVYATFIGGNSWELGYGIAANEKGEVIFCGFSQSANFPITGAVFQPDRGGGDSEGFIAKLSSDGDSLLFASHFGGSDREFIYDMRLGADESIYLTGLTQSWDMPTTPTAFDTTYEGSGDAFIAHISADGSQLLYSTFLGGSNFDLTNALAVEEDGEVWVAGYTSSTDYPVSVDAYQSSLIISTVSQQDGFYAKLSPDGSSLAYSSYLGGDRSDDIQAFTLAPNGDLIMGGYTYSWDWPTTANALAPALTSSHGYGEATLMRFDSSGTHLIHGTLLGGEYMDYIKCVQVKDTHEVYVLGATQSSNFPVTSGSNGHGGGYDAFVSVIQTQTGTLMGSSLFGGGLNDYPRSNSAMQIDSTVATLAITTHSTGMPATGSPLQGSKLNGNNDAPWIGSVQYDVILPAEVSTLTAALDEDGNAELTWQQELELPATYTVTRLAEDQQWKSLGDVQGLPSIADYEFLDREVAQYAGQTLYYRLHVTNAEGYTSSGQTVALAIPSRPGLSWTLFPNPATDQVHISWENGADATGILTVRDLLGRTIHQQTKLQGSRLTTLFTQGWKAGVYWVQFAAPGQPLQQQALQVR